VNIATLLSTALHENHHVLPARAQQQLVDYLNQLQVWNRVFNLTRITAPREMVYLHIMDSLAMQPFLQGTHLLDVGSGAGLPGIPLAITHPHQHWTLLDKNSKKTRFLTQIVADLGLKNVTVIHSHSNHFHPAQGFDSILSRAFGKITMFIETTRHLLRPRGCWIAMKGKYPQEELSALPAYFIVHRITPLSISGMPMERHVVCLGQRESLSA
jgi:16S rRNA (guanine527-N7)-methyltransferase